MRVCVSAAAWRCLSAGTVLNCLDFLIFPFVLQFFWDFFSYFTPSCLALTCVFSSHPYLNALVFFLQVIRLEIVF